MSPQAVGISGLSLADMPCNNPVAAATTGSCIGAGDEARTRYLHLGKVALYQMSYARIVPKAVYMKNALEYLAVWCLRSELNRQTCLIIILTCGMLISKSEHLQRFAGVRIVGNYHLRNCQYHL